MLEKINRNEFNGYEADEIRLALVGNIQGIRDLMYGSDSDSEDFPAKLKFYNEGLATLVQEIQKSKDLQLQYDAIALTMSVDAFDNAIFNGTADLSLLSDPLNKLDIIYAKYAHLKISTSN